MHRGHRPAACALQLSRRGAARRAFWHHPADGVIPRLSYSRPSPAISLCFPCFFSSAIPSSRTHSFFCVSRAFPTTTYFFFGIHAPAGGWQPILESLHLRSPRFTPTRSSRRSSSPVASSFCVSASYAFSCRNCVSASPRNSQRFGRPRPAAPSTIKLGLILLPPTSRLGGVHARRTDALSASSSVFLGLTLGCCKNQLVLLVN